MLDFLAAQPEVADTKVGTTGYCMGGGLALTPPAGSPTGSAPRRRSTAARSRARRPTARTCWPAR